MTQTYINAICRIGQQQPCGLPVTHAIAVTTVTDIAWAEEAREGGVVGLCEYHASTPPADWKQPTATEGDAR